MLELPDRLGLDLPDTFPGHLEDPADLFEGVGVSIADSIAKLEDLTLTIGQGLEDIIDVSVVKPEMLDDGWEIDDEISRSLGYHPSPTKGVDFLRDIYLKARSDYTGRVTVPVLWDKKSGTIKGF